MQDHWWKVTAQRTIEEATLEELGRFEFDFISPPQPMTEADRKVLREAVKDAIERIKKYAIPYFEQVAREVPESAGNAGPDGGTER